MKLNVSGTPPAAYRGSNQQIEILSDDRRVVIGYAYRTGLTAPYYPDHPVYEFTERPWERPAVRLNSWLPVGHWVWDGVEFHESKQWHADHAQEALATYEKRQSQIMADRHKTKPRSKGARIE